MELLDREANVGRTVTLTGASEFQDVLNLESDNKVSRAVTFHTIQAQALGIVGAGSFLEGRIFWGAGGVQSVATFDWLFGTTFSVVGAFMRLQVRSTAALPGGTSVKAGAFAGYGDAGAGPRLNPQLTIPAGVVIAGAAGVNVAIPPFAKDVFVSRRLSGALGAPPAMRVSLRPTLFVATEDAVEQYALGVPMERPMPLQPGAPFARVTNLGAANMLASFIFGLSL
jgi:hypothetical protein